MGFNKRIKEIRAIMRRNELFLIDKLKISLYALRLGRLHVDSNLKISEACESLNKLDSPEPSLSIWNIGIIYDLTLSRMKNLKNYKQIT